MLAIILWCVHVGGAIVLVLTPLALGWRACLLVAVCASFVFALRAHAFRSTPHAVTRMEMREGDWTVGSDSGRIEGCQVVAQFVHPWFVVLRLKPETGRALSVVVARDSLAAGSFRALRARLNLASPAV